MQPQSLHCLISLTCPPIQLKTSLNLSIYRKQIFYGVIASLTLGFINLGAETSCLPMGLVTPGRILTIQPPHTPGQTQSLGSRLWSVSEIANVSLRHDTWVIRHDPNSPTAACPHHRSTQCPETPRCSGQTRRQRGRGRTPGEIGGNKY